MTRTRKNYSVLYQTLVKNDPDKSPEKKKEYKAVFRRRCDCCKKMRYTTSGDVFEFSFYCEACCSTIQTQECSTCAQKDILVSRKCLVCFNEERKKKISKPTVDRYYRDCHKCGNFGFVLRFDDFAVENRKGICVPCLEKPITCTSCGNAATFFNSMCICCYKAREKVLANNPFYPLTLCKDS